MERREAPAFLATGARQDGRLVRHSVLHPLGLSEGEKGKTAYPAPQRTGAMTRACPLFVMPGLDPGIHDHGVAGKRLT